MKKLMLSLYLVVMVSSSKQEHKDFEIKEEISQENAESTTAELKEELTSIGYEIFDYVDEKTQDTILMQQ